MDTHTHSIRDVGILYLSSKFIYISDRNLWTHTHTHTHTHTFNKQTDTHRDMNIIDKRCVS